MVKNLDFTCAHKLDNISEGQIYLMKEEFVEMTDIDWVLDE